MRVVDVLVATNRPSVVAFLKQLGEHSEPPLSIRRIPLAPEPDCLELGAASVALVDMGTDADAGVALCEALRRGRPELPVVAIVCCPSPTMPWHVRGLRAVGVRNLLDAQATPVEIVDALHALARGDAGLRVQFHEQYQALWEADDLISEDGRVILKLVAHGFGDAEIATRMSVSPRTAQSRVEELRERVGARNRAELAAWAGAHGLYRPRIREPVAEPANTRSVSNENFYFKLTEIDLADSGNQFARTGKKSAQSGSHICQF